SSGQLHLNRMAILALIAAAIWVAFAGSSRPGMIPAIIGGASAGIALFTAIMGPVVMRDDLRNDLLYLDLIKSYPVPGWSVVLGEVLAPAAILACAEWFLLFLTLSFLPDVGNFDLSRYHRAMLGISAALLLPCFSLLGLLIQNAAALLMP